MRHAKHIWDKTFQATSWRWIGRCLHIQYVINAMDYFSCTWCCIVQILSCCFNLCNLKWSLISKNFEVSMKCRRKVSKIGKEYVMQRDWAITAYQCWGVWLSTHSLGHRAAEMKPPPDLHPCKRLWSSFHWYWKTKKETKSLTQCV